MGEAQPERAGSAHLVRQIHDRLEGLVHACGPSHIRVAERPQRNAVVIEDRVSLGSGVPAARQSVQSRVPAARICPAAHLVRVVRRDSPGRDVAQQRRGHGDLEPVVGRVAARSGNSGEPIGGSGHLVACAYNELGPSDGLGRRQGRAPRLMGAMHQPSRPLGGVVVGKDACGVLCHGPQRTKGLSQDRLEPGTATWHNGSHDNGIAAHREGPLLGIR